MEVKWLKKALKNLHEEAEYIAKDNPQEAKLVIQRIHQQVSLLIKNPALGRIGRVPETRELVVPKTRYIIPYRVNSKHNLIEILRLFHTSRKQPNHW